MTSNINDHDISTLKKELLGLFEHLQTIRREIASIRRPDMSDDHFATMSEQLDAITKATEAATNTIMESVESVDDTLATIRQKSDDTEIQALAESASDRIVSVFEACSFQDITGQRVGKVVESLKFVEGRINSLISIWGPDQLAAVAEAELHHKDANKDDEHRSLHGPQNDVSQDRVDELFGNPGSDVSQDDIDKLFG